MERRGLKDFSYKGKALLQTKAFVIIYMFFLLLMSNPFFTIIETVKAEGPDYYVNGTLGSDSNNGSLSFPFATIQKGLNETEAGGTLYIMAGEYNEALTIKNNGSTGNTIIICPYQNDNVIINGSGKTGYNGIVKFDTKCHYRFTGIELHTSTSFGIFLEESGTHNITIDNCTIHDCRNSSIYCRRHGTPNMEHIIFDNNTCYSICRDPAALPKIRGQNGLSCSQEGISFSGVSYFEIKNNDIYDCGRECIDMKSGTSNGLCYGNIVNNSNDNNDDENDLGIYIDGYGDNCNNITVYNNFVTGNGTGYKITAEVPGGSVTNVSFYNNIAYMSQSGDSTHLALTFDSYTGTTYDYIKFINNVFYTIDNEKAIQMNMTSAAMGDHCIFRNNIVASDHHYQLQAQNLNLADWEGFDNNSFWNNTGGTEHVGMLDGDDTFGSDYLTSDPKFASVASRHFWLNSTSPCINNGSSIDAPSFDYNGTIRPQGSGYDIGAWEYNEGGSSSGFSGTNHTILWILITVMSIFLIVGIATSGGKR